MIRIIVALLTFGCLWPGLGVAQQVESTLTVQKPATSATTQAPAPSPVGLEGLVREALQKNPAVQSALHTVEAQRRRVPQAKTLPDPTVGIGWAGNITPFSVQSGDPSSYRAVAASQQLLYPGKLKLRGEIASKEADTASSDLEAVRRRVATDVKTAYFEYWFYDKAIQTTLKDKDLLSKLSQIAEARYRVGKGVQQDVLRSQVEISLLLQRLTVLQQQRNTSQARLNTLLARSPEAQLPPAENIERSPLHYSLDDLYRLARQNDPGRVKYPITVLVMLFVVTLHAWSQTQRYTVPAASVGDDFAAYGRALDTAADSALANVTREAELSSRIVEARTNTTRPPDANVLHQFAEQYWNGNDQAVRRAVARVVELKPVLAPILQDEGVPDEIATIVLVESGGQPTALSPKGARGIWQFMPDTARRFGLTINSETDDRLNILKSTRAAARYLRDLHEQFGDRSLALAAYNAGEIVVRNAVLRAGSNDFAVLSSRRLIPAETRAYVPAVMAASKLFAANGLLNGSSPKILRSRAILYAQPTTGPQQ